MAVYNFKPTRQTKYLQEGEYTATIEKIQFSEHKGYFAFDFRGENFIFNTVFTTKNTVLNNFISDYVDDDGNFVDDQLIGRQVVFTVEDGAIDAEGNIRSRISVIKAI